MNVSLPNLAESAWTQLWQVTALTLAVACAARLCARRRPHLAYMLWLLVIVKCLTPPIWASPTGIFSWARASAVVPPDDQALVDVARAEATRETLSDAAPVPVSDGPLGAPRVLDGRTSAAVLQPATVLGIVWLGGVAICLAIAVRTWAGWLSLLRHSARVADGPLAAKAAELSARLGLRQKVQLRVTPRPIGPAVLGILRPKLLLPEALVSGKSPRELEPILAHELIHVRRGDAAVGALQMLAQMFWWFHPLIWWASRAACLERERCCDEETVAGLRCRPEHYAQSLLDVLRLRRQTLRLSAVLGMSPFQATRLRLENVMHHHPRFVRRMPRAYWLVLAVGILLFIPGAGLESPRVLGSLSDAPAAEPAATAPPAQATTAEKSSPLSPGLHRRVEVGKNYVVFAVTTDLQRRLLNFRPDAQTSEKAYVLINGVACVREDGTIDTKALDTSAIRKALSPYRDPKQGTVNVTVCFPLTVDLPKEREPTLRQSLRRFGEEAGFRRAVVSYSYQGQRFEWDDYVAEIRKSIDRGSDGDETPVGDDLVKVYPVRTALGRHLSGGADCVAEVLSPITKADTPIFKDEITDAIRRHLQKLNLKDKGRLLLCVSPTETARQAVHEFEQWELQTYARSLGFTEGRLTSYFGR